MARKILVLHHGPDAPEAVAGLAGDLESLGAEVRLVPCTEPYGAVLDAVAEADAVVFYS